MVGLVGRRKQAQEEGVEEEEIDEGREGFDVNDNRKRRSFAFCFVGVCRCGMQSGSRDGLLGGGLLLGYEDLSNKLRVGICALRCDACSSNSRVLMH